MREPSDTPRVDAYDRVWFDSDGPDALAYRALARKLERELAASQARAETLKAHLIDACELLTGWIARYCKPVYRAEHMADVEKKRAATEEGDRHDN